MPLDDGQQAFVHTDVWNTQVTGQQLHMRQGVALTGGHDARNRRQVRDSLWQEIDAVVRECAKLLQVRAGMQGTAGQPRVEGTETHPDLLAEQFVTHPGQLVRVTLQAVEQLRKKQQRRTAQLILDEM